MLERRRIACVNIYIRGVVPEKLYKHISNLHKNSFVHIALNEMTLRNISMLSVHTLVHTQCS